MPPGRVTTSDPIPVDRLVGEGPALQIRWLLPEEPVLGASVRETHRHDYHELFVLSEGEMHHRVDDQVVEHKDGSVLLVGRGQMHVLEHAHQARGVVVRFSEEMLASATQPASPGWFLVHARTCLMKPSATELQDLQGLVRMLDDEIRRPDDSRSGTLQTFYLSAALLLIDRWQEAQVSDMPVPTAPEVVLFQQFARLLEAEYAHHHDASWYAEQLAVSVNHLATTLGALTGRSTKKLIIDRVMTEAQRLLRHTNLTGQQIAYRLGYDDPLYFSRAFRQHVGSPPSAYRQHTGTAV